MGRMAGLKIGRVAARAGVKVDTVRYYERRGVLPPADRQPSGYRAFPAEAIERIRFVKQMQALGFTLDELIALLGRMDEGDASCAVARPHVRAALSRLQERIAAMTEVRDKLQTILGRCEGEDCVLLAEVAPAVGMTRRRTR